ncbi:unnamed protein product [Cuscuta campestris]|uniref:Uncharacterized protein n=1 Tax=Cuscuta campestris TaxID=132261 RepID=A0A484NJ74_9ASTE|nr:unnamed protein product [Cuscuta campestris]
MDVFNSATTRQDVLHRKESVVTTGGGICVHPRGLILTVEHILPSGCTVEYIHARHIDDLGLRWNCVFVASDAGCDLGLFWVGERLELEEQFEWVNLEEEESNRLDGLAVGDRVFSFVHRLKIPYSYFKGVVAYPLPTASSIDLDYGSIISRARAEELSEWEDTSFATRELRLTPLGHCYAACTGRSAPFLCGPSQQIMRGRGSTLMKGPHSGKGGGGGHHKRGPPSGKGSSSHHRMKLRFK